MKLNLALYKRALLLDSRRFILYGTWMMMGTLFLLKLSSLKTGSSGSKGLEFLSLVAHVNYWFILLAGIFGFSSAISEEKDEDTMGLLVMTGISPFTLILSKAGARFTRGLFLIATQIPFTTFAVTLGGVSNNQVYAVYITLISFMFMITFLFTLISLLSNNSRQAATMSILVVIFSFLLTFFLARADVIDRTQIVYFMNNYALFEILTTGFTDTFVARQVYPCLIQGLLFFLISLYLFKSFALRVPKGKSSKKKLFSRNKRTWNYALPWKEFYFQLSGFKGWIFQAVIMLVFLIIVVNLGADFRNAKSVIFFLLWTSFILSILVLTIMASNMFSAEFKSGTHSSIFTLPIDHFQIFLGKLLGGLLFALPSLLIFFISFIIIALEYSRYIEFELLLIIPSFILLYLMLTAYLSLIIRIGAFIAAGALIFVGYAILGFVIISNLGGAEAAVFFCFFVNTVVTFMLFNMMNNKLTELKGR